MAGARPAHPAHPVHPFVAATTWPRDGDVFTTTIDPRWYQGRGAYGGLLAAGALRSMMAVVDDARRRPRSLDVHFCAPVREGRLEVEVVVERAGASIMTLSARARQEGKVACLATGTFSFPREGSPRARYAFRPRPAAPSPAQVAPVPDDVPLMPTFTQFFEYRMCVGGLPYSSSDSARLGGWVRPRPFPGEGVALDAPLAAALLDAYPPAVLARLDEPRGAASVNLTVDFHVELPRAAAAPDAHALVVLTSDNGDGGTTDEHAELWSEDGVHVASCRQLVALF